LPKLIVRFYGRFTYAVAHAEGAVTGEISVIAPQFHPPFREHHPRMTVPRNVVALGKELTTVEPLLKVVGDAPNVLEAEMFIWGLDGLNVGFLPDPDQARRPSATLGLAESDRVIPDLGALVENIGQKATLDPGALSASKDVNAKARAVVKLTEGRGVGKMAIETDNAFLIDRKTAERNPTPTANELTALVSNLHNRRAADGQFVSFKKADVVEFEIEVARNVPFTFTLTDPLTRKVEHVSVVARTMEARVMVNFSNLCPGIPMDEVYDLEFAQYYNLLHGDPAGDALILVPSDDGGEPGECDSEARIDYEPSR
jgi:hypothetical protein